MFLYSENFKFISSFVEEIIKFVYFKISNLFLCIIIVRIENPGLEGYCSDFLFCGKLIT